MNSQDNEIGVFFGGTNYIGDIGPTTYVYPFPATHSLTNEKSSFITGADIAVDGGWLTKGI